MVSFLLTFEFLSSIYLSFLLTLLISLALNPLVNRLRIFTGGRKGATAAVVFGTVLIFALSGWAFYLPLRDSVSNLSEALPGYWERLQKPLIKMEQHAKRTEMRMQAEVNTEITKATEVNQEEDREKSPDRVPADVSAGSNNLRSGLAQMLMVLITVFFGVIFMLMNPRPIIGAFFSLVPVEHHETATAIMARGMKLRAVAVIFSMLLCVSAFGVLGVLIAAPLVAVVSIFHEELYRKKYLPTVTDADLDRLARNALHETITAID